MLIFFHCIKRYWWGFLFILCIALRHFHNSCVHGSFTVCGRRYRWSCFCIICWPIFWLYKFPVVFWRICEEHLAACIWSTVCDGASSLLPSALDLLFDFFWTAVYNISTVCGGIGGVSSSSFGSQTFGFFLIAVYRSLIVWGHLMSIRRNWRPLFSCLTLWVFFLLLAFINSYINTGVLMCFLWW